MTSTTTDLTPEFTPREPTDEQLRWLTNRLAHLADAPFLAAILFRVPTSNDDRIQYDPVVRVHKVAALLGQSPAAAMRMGLTSRPRPDHRVEDIAGIAERHGVDGAILTELIELAERGEPFPVQISGRGDRSRQAIRPSSSEHHG